MIPAQTRFAFVERRADSHQTRGAGTASHRSSRSSHPWCVSLPSLHLRAAGRLNLLDNALGYDAQNTGRRIGLRFQVSSEERAFVSPIIDFPGRRRGNQILMWGTTSFCDELTDDFGGAFEAISIDGCRLFCRLAEILPHSVLGLLQHNPPMSRHS